VRIEYTEAFYTNCTVFYDTRTDSQKEDSFTTHGVVLQAGALVDVENILNTRLNNMCIGDVRKVTASAKYAYGELAMDLGEKRGNVQVPANSTIIYQIEVLDITPSDEIPEDLLQNMLAKSKGAVVKSDPMGGALGALDLYKRVKLTEELHPEWSATEQGKGVIEQATKEYDYIMEQMEVEKAKKAEREAKKAAKEAAEEEL
jgi:FKBP-type peptidyl-prolyl cis-trans isomerase